MAGYFLDLDDGKTKWGSFNVCYERGGRERNERETTWKRRRVNTDEKKRKIHPQTEKPSRENNERGSSEKKEEVLRRGKNEKGKDHYLADTYAMEYRSMEVPR